MSHKQVIIGTLINFGKPYPSMEVIEVKLVSQHLKKKKKISDSLAKTFCISENSNGSFSIPAVGST